MQKLQYKKKLLRNYDPTKIFNNAIFDQKHQLEKMHESQSACLFRSALLLGTLVTLLGPLIRFNGTRHLLEIPF